GLEHRDAACLRDLLHGRRRHLMAPSPGFVRLGEDAHHRVPCGDDRLERGHREVGRAHKDDQSTPHASRSTATPVSPALSLYASATAVRQMELPLTVSRIPSKWSYSCCSARASKPSALMRTVRHRSSQPSTSTRAARSS